MVSYLTGLSSLESYRSTLASTILFLVGFNSNLDYKEHYFAKMHAGLLITFYLTVDLSKGSIIWFVRLGSI